MTETAQEAGRALASGPVVTGTVHPGYTVDAATARSATLTVAEHAPEGEVPLLLAVLGITTGESGRSAKGEERHA